MAKKESDGYQGIAARLRERWLTDWQPGRKLPTYQELCTEFGAAIMTVRRAVELLTDQGFIVTR